MTIKKFIGKTETEATAMAKEEFGEGTVIMNVKEIKPKGILRSFKTSMYEVTAAVEESDSRQAVRPQMPAMPQMPAHVPAQANINMAADEPISIPRAEDMKEVFASVENTWASSMTQENKEEYKNEEVADLNSSNASSSLNNTGSTNNANNNANNLEEKLENLQSLLEKKLSQPIEEQKDELIQEAPIDENLKFVKMIYSILLDNEVDEKYVNQIFDEVEKVMKKGASLDYILSSIYRSYRRWENDYDC